ncbi:MULTISPECIES: hypothetical protein [unclassified Sphingosinithalassobacter]|uniref:hypothetical protein n=1 Tax=unclassified Sphingosinithalassobacter TaxID=2676235 RepID=UPI00165E1EA8|nr:hypothetical protein [Sphingosinithalassobacter sp. CS137]
MDRRRRRWRLGLLVGVAVAVLWAAWRLGPGEPGLKEECTPGRVIERDDAGEVVEIRRTECREAE